MNVFIALRQSGRQKATVRGPNSFCRRNPAGRGCECGIRVLNLNRHRDLNVIGPESMDFSDSFFGSSSNPFVGDGWMRAACTITIDSFLDDRHFNIPEELLRLARRRLITGNQHHGNLEVAGDQRVQPGFPNPRTVDAHVVDDLGHPGMIENGPCGPGGSMRP